METVAGTPGKASGKGSANYGEYDDGDSHDRKIAQKRLGSRARATETDIDQCQAGNGQRSDQQERQGEDDEGVGHDRRYGRRHGRLSPRGRMCPRTATPKPSASTARPQRTKAARCVGSVKRTIAAIA